MRFPFQEVCSLDTGASFFSGLIVQPQRSSRTAAQTYMASKQEPFLEKLANAFGLLEKQSSVNTRDFTDAIEKLFPVFDHLGGASRNFKAFW